MNEFIEPEESDDLLNDNYFKNILEETRKWTKFLAIIGFIMIGLIVIVSIGIIIGGGFFGSLTQGLGSSAYSIGVGVAYLVMALIYYFPTKYIYDFSSYLDKSLDSGSIQMFKEAHGKLKSLFKFIGIFTIIIISIYILVIIMAIVTTL